MTLYIMRNYILSMAVSAAFVGASLSASAQKVYSTDYKYQADVNVFVTDREYKADLVVYKTKHSYNAKANENKGIWYFTKHQYDADKKIYFVDHEYQADIIIYFTDKEYKAGWKKNDKKYLMY